ncbi:BLUF domain-containing protein [Pseudoalteromonas sp. SSM20]|uniref:BLUF domain-containing protein n=1 Tax=Pseudoalteromonas sp. SSM20 TaxID=3139394 RepID=UPI003BA8682C
MVNSIVYLSKANREFTEQELQALCADFATKNKLLNITGFLYFKNGMFLQYIESSDDAVQTLLKTLKKDDRHTIYFECSFNTFSTICFPSWQMNWLTLNLGFNQSNQQLLLNTIQFIVNMDLSEGNHLETIKNLVLRVRDTIYCL